MIVNFKYTKWFITRFLFATSIIANIYAAIMLTAIEKCDTSAIEHQLDLAEEYYVINFGEK